MIKRILMCGVALVATYGFSHGQYSVEYHPSIQPTRNMQYFKPEGNLNVGDCMPFFRDGTFSLYWLIDSLHGNNLGGLGGHQWVLSKTKDLISWQQDSIVIGIDEPWEKSICTGSIVFYRGKYYAFYATRLVNHGQVNEQLSYAVSDDGIHFSKQRPNPFYTSAPGYSKRNFRDPKVFVDSTGAFHLFVASEQENAVMKPASGCLVHLVSRDLKTWKVLSPVLTGQGSVPECPDYFYWKGWYYLIYSDNSNTHYVMSRNPYGPWKQPRYQALNEDWANVVKTAAFKNGRRIAAAWIPDRSQGKDNGGEIFGGNLVFREIIQEPDGTLDTKFPEEMIPASGEPASVKIIADLFARSDDSRNCTINAPDGQGAAHLERVPLNCRITLSMDPLDVNEDYGLVLRSGPRGEGGYRLNFSAIEKTVQLGNTSIHAVSGLDHKINVDIIMKNDVIDVCVDGKRCIVNRAPEQKGPFLWLYAKHGKVMFQSLKIHILK